jgi:tetratricopeptide (TPR) repeat protein
MDIKEILILAKEADGAGHSASAFELFKRAIDRDPGNDTAIYRAVNNLIELGRISDADCLLEKIKRNAAPKPWLIEAVLGHLRSAQFRLEEAEVHYRNARKLGQSSTAPAVFLADFLMKQEKFSEAADILNEAIKTEGNLDEVYLNLALIKRSTGEYKAARDYLLKALALSPDYESAKRALSDVESWLSLKIKIDGD